MRNSQDDSDDHNDDRNDSVDEEDERRSERAKGKKKKKKKRSVESDDEDGDHEGELFQLDIEFFDPKQDDFWGMKYVHTFATCDSQMSSVFIHSMSEEFCNAESWR